MSTCCGDSSVDPEMGATTCPPASQDRGMCEILPPALSLHGAFQKELYRDAEAQRCRGDSVVPMALISVEQGKLISPGCRLWSHLRPGDETPVPVFGGSILMNAVAVKAHRDRVWVKAACSFG